MNYIERLNIERNDLDIKIFKLDLFLSKHSDELDEIEYKYIQDQKRVMSEYLNILGKRIAFATNK